jgi:hypothetical protein
MRRALGACSVLVAVLGAGGPRPTAAARDLRDYSPSTLLVPGESELKLFHNLYTQTRTFDDAGRRTDPGARSTWYTGTATLRVGWRPRANPGVDVTVRAVKDGTRLPSFDSRSGLTAISPWVQIAPLRSRPELTVRTGLRIPLGSELEGDGKRPFLDFADPAAFALLLRDAPLGSAFRLYLEGGGVVRIAGDASQLTSPARAILNLEPSGRWSLYVPAEMQRDWLGDAAGSWWAQTGLGAKLRPGDGSAELEVLWTAFVAGRSAGAGQTFNLGIRFLR